MLLNTLILEIYIQLFANYMQREKNIFESESSHENMINIIMIILERLKHTIQLLTDRRRGQHPGWSASKAQGGFSTSHTVLQKSHDFFFSWA